MKYREKEVDPVGIKCLCGHNVRILYNNHKIYCRHCGRYVNTPKLREFKYNILKKCDKNDKM